MMNPLDVYARAVARLPLTPGERALLKTADALLLASLAGGAVAVVKALLAGGQPLSLQTLWQVFLYAAATAVLTGSAKLFRAHGDATSLALADELDAEAAAVERKAPAPVAQVPARPMAARVATATATIDAVDALADATTRPVPVAQTPILSRLGKSSASITPAPLASAPASAPLPEPQALPVVTAPVVAAPSASSAPVVTPVPASSAQGVISGSMPRTPPAADQPPAVEPGATLPNIPAFLKS